MADLVNIRSSYKKYTKEADNPVDMPTYTKIAALYNKFLMEKVIFHNEEVLLPAKLGTLSVIGRKQKIRFDEGGKPVGLSPDWVGTKKLWDSNPKAKAEKKLLYHTNEHTAGVRYKFLWSKKRVLVRNKSLYSMKLTRTNKRLLHKAILYGKEYIQIN